MELGEKAKKFTNVFIKNFGEELTEQELTDMFAKFGKITSIKVNTCSSRGHGRVGGIAQLIAHWLQVPVVPLPNHCSGSFFTEECVNILIVGHSSSTEESSKAQTLVRLGCI